MQRDDSWQETVDGPTKMRTDAKFHPRPQEPLTIPIQADNGHEQSRLAAQLSTEIFARVPTILDNYESRLLAAESPLIADPKTWRECRAYARSIVWACAKSVQAPESLRKDNGDRDMVSRIGTAPVSRSLHPLESLRADTILTDVLLHELEALMTGRPELTPLVIRAVRMANASVAEGVERAADSYDSFLDHRIKRVQDDNCRRLGREIHDHIGNSISLALRQLELYEAAYTEDIAHAYKRVIQARDTLTEALANTRQVVSELRLFNPLSSIREALETFMDASGVPDGTILLAVEGDENRIPGHARSELFTVIREGLRNVLKHSHASQVVIRIRIEATGLSAVVEDNGTGFDVVATTAGHAHGLDSMAERIGMLDGSVTIISTPGRGTSISLWIPLTPGRRCDPRP